MQRKSFGFLITGLTLGQLLLGSFNRVHASDFHSPRTLALGGAGHAGPLLNDAIYLNPAFASLLKTYSASLSYLRYWGNEPYRGRNYNVSIQDAQTELFQAGIGYSMREEGALVSVGASKAVIDTLALGVGAKVLFGNNKKTANDTMISAAYVPVPWLQLSFTLDNLIESQTSKDRGLYREFVIGSKWNIMNIVIVYVDPHFAPSVSGSSFGHEAGLEFAVMSDLFLRIGHLDNASIPYQNGGRGDGFGAGVGLVLGRVSLDYGFAHLDSNSSVHKVNVHTLGFTGFF